MITIKIRTIDITHEMIMALPMEQACKLHNEVVGFINDHYQDVADNGLVDDILFNEYKACVEKLATPSISEVEKQQHLNSLSVLLWQIVNTAALNLSNNPKESVYADFLKCVAGVF